MDARVRLIVQDVQTDQFGQFLVLLDVDLQEYVRRQLTAVVNPEIASRVRIGLRLDVPIRVMANEWINCHSDEVAT